MAQTFSCILLLLSLCATFGKYVHIQELKNWHEAQEYCRLFHTDLAPVSNNYDMRRLRRLVGEFHNYIWIGLWRSCTDCEWTWSGGGAVSTFFWAPWQPDNQQNQNYGLIRNNMWHDAISTYLLPSLCYSVVVVRERKTWEEALDHCREHHRDLASVASDTEMLLIQKELSKNDTTARVWMGLRFFPGGWLWVDGQPLEYQAWGQEGGPECPGVKRRCAALQVTANNGTDFTPVPEAAGGMEPLNSYSGGNISARAGLYGRDVGGSVWEAHDCVERHHFICY